MASLSSLFLILIAVSPFTMFSRVHGGEVGHRHTISVAALLPPTVCNSTPASNNGTLKIVHRHGPCSPFAADAPPSQGRILHQDRARVTSIHNKLSASAADGSSIPARRDLSFDTLEYIVTVGFGTPTRDLTLIFDTGSDVTWTQCEPCASSCYPQKEPIFDPLQSSTYSAVPCAAADCSLAGAPPACSSGVCLYGVKYGDGSVTEGIFSEDTLTLTSSDVLDDFKFGCSELTQGYFGAVAGLLGLGRGKASLVSQASAKYGGVFSYCLPPFSSSTGYLVLGAGVKSNSIAYTPMVSNSKNPSFYFVDLIAIGVGGHDLPIESTVFTNVGTVLDSGTVITRIPPLAYAALSKEFRKQMSEYPAAPPFPPLDTCFDLSGFDKVSVPPVAMRFTGGATVNVDASGILFMMNISQACLAFAANDDESLPSIIGNMQQRTYDVVYDIPNGRIGFGSGGCS